MQIEWKGKTVELLEDLTFEGGIVPKGFVSDGVSIPVIFMRLFTKNDINRGAKAAMIHDYQCINHTQFKRKEATALLVNNWKEAGLGSEWYTSWKPLLVTFGVNVYHWYKGWK